METIENATLPGYSSQVSQSDRLQPLARCYSGHWSAPLQTAAESGCTGGMFHRSERDFNIKQTSKQYKNGRT